MKEQIIDNLVRGLVLAAIAWIGLRGVLPDIVAAGNLPALVLAGASAIAGYAVGPAVYQAYRCADRCDSTCDPRFCLAK